MSQSNPQSLARILVAPWQQRRGINSRWGPILVVLLCLAGPVVLGTWSLFCDPSEVAKLRDSAVFSGWAAAVAMVGAGWAVFVGNVLQQNHPTLARLVPHHPGQLRLALLVGWALVMLGAAALPGFAFDAPLAWACGTAASLALVAAALRWPLLWLAAFVGPIVAGGLTHFFGAGETLEALVAAWTQHQVLVTCFVAVTGAAVLLQVVRSGGATHMAAYERRQRLRAVLQQQGGGNLPASCGRFGWLVGLGFHGRAYAWWMARLLARPDSPVTSRLRVGLGPANHWTTRIFQAAWFVVLCVVVCVPLSLAMGRGMLAYALPWFGFSVLTSVCSPSLMAVPRLRQTQREQALLVLLPGVPRGARLNRWLGWEMSVTFVIAAAVALGLAWLLNALADAIRPGVALQATGGLTFGMAAVLVPQVAWQWRHWARLRGATAVASQIPTLAPIVLGVGVMVLHIKTGVGYVPVGVAMTVGAVAYCAWRWARMGREATAFPVGRLG